MIIYAINLALVVLFATLAEKYRENRIISNAMIFAVCASLITTASLRWGVGTDFFNYKDIYWIGARQTFEQAFNAEKEILFSVFTWAVAHFSNEDYKLYIFLIACLIYIPITLTMKKRAVQFMPCMLFYILINMYASAYNGMRQWIAVAIMFAAFSLLENKKYIWYAFWVFVAFQIHFTTIIILPFMIVIASNMSFGKKLFIEALLFVGVTFLVPLWGTAMSFLEGIGAERYVQSYGNALEDSYGAKFIRVVFQLPPIILSIWRFNCIDDIDERRDFEKYLHMSIYSAIFCFAGTRFVSLTRFASYFDIFNCLLLPVIIRSGRTKKECNLLAFCIIAVYIVAWYVFLHVDSQLLPFKFENGMRFY